MIRAQKLKRNFIVLIQFTRGAAASSRACLALTLFISKAARSCPSGTPGFLPHLGNTVVAVAKPGSGVEEQEAGADFTESTLVGAKLWRPHACSLLC